MSEPSGGTRDREQLLDEVLFAYLREAEGGGTPDRRGWLQRYPDLAAELTAFFANQDRIDGMASPLRQVACSHAHLSSGHCQPPFCVAAQPQRESRLSTLSEISPAL